MAKTKRLNKNLIVGLTAVGFVIMTAAGVILVSRLEERNPQHFEDLADQAFAKGEWKGARNFYGRAYEVERDKVTAAAYLVKIGNTFLEEGDEPRATSTWNQAVTINPQLKEAYEKLIDIRLEYSRSARPPDHWLALKKYAEGLVGTEDDADEDRLDAQNPRGLFALGVALVELDKQQQEEGNETLGREKIRQAIKLAPNEVEYGARLARYHVYDEDYDGAEALYTQLVESNPDPGSAAVEARIQYADFLLSRQQHRELAGERQVEDRELAGQLLVQASELAGDDPEIRAKALTARARHSLIHWQQSRDDADVPEDVDAAEEARRLCKEAIEVDPDSFDPYRLLGNLYSMQDKMPEAIEVCEARLERPIIRVGSKRRTQKQLRYMLLIQVAELYRAQALGLDLGGPERDEALNKAIEYVREASAEIPGSGLTLETEAAIRHAQGELKQAIRLSQAADELYGEQIRWRNKLRLATLLAREREFGAAREAIEAVCLNPDFADPRSGVSAGCWTTYAGILLQLGNEPQRVLFATKEALRRDPSSQRAMSIQASALRQLGREDEARRLLDEIARVGGGDFAEQVREREFLRNVQTLVSEEKVEQAIRLLLDALEEDPGHELYVVNAAVLLERQGRKDEAIGILKRAIEANPDSLAFKNALVTMDETMTEDERRAAIGAQVLEEIEKIEDAFTQAIGMAAYHSHQERRDHAEADKHLAEAQRLFLEKATPDARAALPEMLSRILVDRLSLALDKGDVALAQDVVGTAIEHNADDADGLTFLGQLRLYQGRRAAEEGRPEEGRRRKEEAAQAFKGALEKLPTNSRMLDAYARVCLELNRLSEARIAFQEAAEINPRDVTAWKGLAVAASMSGEDDLFAQYVARCVELDPNDPAVRDWATMLQERESPEDGIARREERRAEDPDDLQNLMRLARLYRIAGENEKAEQCYEQALKNPEAGPAETMAAADFYRDTARPDQGLQLLEALVKSADDPDTKAEYQLLIGTYYANLGDFKQADASMLAAADIKETQVVCVALGRHFFQTRQEDEANRLDRAIEWLEKAVLLAEKDESAQAPWIRRMIIESFLTAGKREQARARYDEYAARYPDDVDKLRLRAELEMDDGRPDQAIATLTEYLEQRSDDPRVLYRRALLLGAQGQTQRACADLERLRAANPGALQFQPRIHLARGYDLMEQLDLAETELKTALEEEPRADNVAWELVNFYEKHNRLSDAEKVVIARLALTPDNAEWHRRAGRLARAQGNATKAVRELVRSCELSQYNWPFVVALMDAFIEFKMVDAGIGFYNDVVPSDRRHPLVISKYARLSAMKGQSDMAVKVFCLAVDRTGTDMTRDLTEIARDAASALGGAKAIDLFGVEPDDDRLKRPAKTLHTVLLAAHERIDEAIAATESLVETSESESERGSLMIMLAILREQKGEPEQARRCYEEGLKTDPEHVMALNNLAYLLAEDLNLPKLALPYAQKAARLNPQAETLDTLGWTYVKTGNYAEAVSALTRAVQRDEYYLPARAHLGEAYRLMRDFESASSTLRLAMRQIEESEDTEDTGYREYRQAVETSLRKVGERNSEP
ncbi:MAG: tetratricopeptide repeat protein [Phycisphaerales bacterium]|nr:MAG: tetratricopeptide repeat protein [Phycisphaerales bacterium]